MSSTTVTPAVSMATTFNAAFKIKVGAYATATVEPDDAEGVVIVTYGDDGERLFTPTEALALAAALQAVAMHLLEEPRELHRNTEPGQPQSEELQGVGL